MDDNLMEQLYDAMLASRKHRKTQFVFREHAMDFWWQSGFLPVNALDFFVLYPTGEFDKSSDAPELGTEEWAAFVASKEKAEAKAWSEVCPRAESEAPTVVGEPAAKPSPWAGFHDVFLGFCAFAPFALLAMALRFARAFSTEDPWAIAWPTVALAMPFTLYGIYRSLGHRSPRMGWTSSALLCDSHLACYGITCFLAKMAEFPDMAKFDYRILAATVMLSLMASGVALLLLWDDKEAKCI